MLELQRIRFAGWALTEGQAHAESIARVFFGPSEVLVLRYSSACKTMFRCRFLAIVDVRLIDRDHAKHASPVEWCLNGEVELLCKLAMPRLSSGV